MKVWRPPSPFSKLSEKSLLGRRLCGTRLVGLRILLVVVLVAAVLVVVVVVVGGGGFVVEVGLVGLL